MLSLAVSAALDSATRFLGDAGCLFYKLSQPLTSQRSGRWGPPSTNFEILDFGFLIETQDIIEPRRRKGREGRIRKEGSQ
ncbi:MAG: hypothetical protein EAZ39_01055 [Oscillatoriales cyanobacterium]|nr:MAG: hypothetical protein EAZ39_01055 [Oscillatoriales cyanobacterium]